MNTVRVVAAMTALVFTIGVGTTIAGLTTNTPTVSITGAYLTGGPLIAAAVLSLWRLHHDTAIERQWLLRATWDQEETRAQYQQAMADLDKERGRARRQLAATTAALEDRRRVMEDALRDDFERRRAQLIAETFSSAAEMFRNGLLDAPAAAPQNVVRLRARDTERQRTPTSRDRDGVTGP